MFVLNRNSTIIALLYVLVFAAPIRAYLFDHEVVYIAPLLLSIGLLLFSFFGSARTRINLNKYALLSFLLFAQLGIFVSVTDDPRVFASAFHFYTPVVYFIAIVIMFDTRSINRHLMIFFKVIFVVESLLILVESVDEFIGFDIHAARLFSWYMEVDQRFDDVILGPNDTVASILEILPPVLGFHGFPHYTAPIYVVSFVFAVAGAFSRTGVVGKAQPNKWVAALILMTGLYCIYALGVKTHFVTATLALLILGVFHSRRILWLFGAFLAIAVPATLLVAAARDRFANLLDQVLVGNEIEGSRLDVIFRFQEYLVLLDLKLSDLLAGTGSFGSLADFERSGLFLEQKILVYALVFGIPYVLIIVGFFVAGIVDSLRVFRNARDPATRTTAIAIGCGLMVYGLEMGHFGFTFNTPNFPLVFAMVGMIAVLARELRQNRALAAHV